MGFENFSFKKELWALAKIPGRESFWDPKFCDNFRDIEYRIYKCPHKDWIAEYMYKNGTWNTPIVLLENIDGSIKFGDGERMKAPYHLLEGHKRLSYLNGLRDLSKALAEHEVWIVNLTKGSY